jgi:hypothetical protein
VAGITTEVAPAHPGTGQVKAMLETVLDSCCRTEEITTSFTITSPAPFDFENIEFGAMIPVEICGDIGFRVVNTQREDCRCLSTVHFQIPIRLTNINSCDCPPRTICRMINILRTVSLCCADDSMLTVPTLRAMAINGIVTDVGCDQFTVSVTLLFRACVQQTIMREYIFDATPVCVRPDCSVRLTLPTDPCDVSCGCVAGAAVSCPTCS